jgi:hypothetical protein
LREVRWEQIDLVHNKALTVGNSKTEAGTGRVIPLNETAIAALETHAAWYTRRFGECRPEWCVRLRYAPPSRSYAPHYVIQDGVDQGPPEGWGDRPVAR